jgi:hypothetical protein
MGQQCAPKFITTHRADHGGASPVPGGGDRLIAAFAAALRPPAPSGQCLALSGAVSGINHDIVVKAADNEDFRALACHLVEILYSSIALNSPKSYRRTIAEAGSLIVDAGRPTQRFKRLNCLAAARAFNPSNSE